MELPVDLQESLNALVLQIMDKGAEIYNRGYTEGAASTGGANEGAIAAAIAAERARIQEGLANIDANEDSAIANLLNPAQ